MYMALHGMYKPLALIRACHRRMEQLNRCEDKGLETYSRARHNI